MKKMLVSLCTLFALALGAQISFAACPCAAPCDPCPCATPCCPAPACDSCCPAAPCTPCADCCCENWLNCKCLDDYFCRIGLNPCQKAEAMQAIEEFKCCTKCVRDKGCKCECKEDCRAYRRALRDLDCKMKQLITKCQKKDYKCVRKEVKNTVKCCHKCLIWPFKLCKCCECGCGCASNCGCGCDCCK